MSDEITERRLRRLFPNHPESFFQRNKHLLGDPGVSDECKQLVGEQVGETQRSEAVGAQYRLKHCKIVYHCSHGQQLDKNDNESYSAVKPIADAIVNLGFSGNDKNFKAKASQRMDNNQADI